MNKQEVFNKVATHLLTQNKKSLSGEERCAYRGQNNTKCAIGCLIPDDKYVSNLEGYSISNKLVMEVLTGELGILEKDDTYLLNALQCLHDYVPTYSWKKRLSQIAERFELNTDILEKF